MGEPLNEIQRASSEQFGKQSHRYGKGHILEKVEDVQKGLEAISLPKGARVLDVATGAGHTGLYLASLGHRVTLCDLTAPMLDRAREAAKEKGLEVETRQHSAEEMPYENGSFDLVTCRVAPHHFSSPESFVREVARVLAPGGHFLLIDGSVYDNEPEAEEWLHRVEKLRDPSHHRFIGRPAWEAMSAASGLKVIRSELHTRQQPDLNWYFEAANTSSQNRAAVLQLVQNASPRVRQVMALTEKDGIISWQWPMLTLVARKS